MKFLLLSLLCGCHVTQPKVLPDITRPSVMEETIKHSMSVQGDPSYFWVLWYIPILAVILSWTWKTFFSKDKK